jgi:hypothetical protein
MPVVEAFACGTAVVASNAGQSRRSQGMPRSWLTPRTFSISRVGSTGYARTKHYVSAFVPLGYNDRPPSDGSNPRMPRLTR